MNTITKLYNYSLIIHASLLGWVDGWMDGWKHFKQVSHPYKTGRIVSFMFLDARQKD
jgi:hypothetical protein